MLPILLLFAAQLPPSAELATRPRSILASSLPQLSRDEELALDALIDRFSRADIGTLTGADATLAIRDFTSLGMESVPALIRGLNRAVEYRHACPALQITRKLTSLLAKSDDAELMDYARDNLGAGVRDDNPYLPRLRQIRVEVTLRRNAILRENPRAVVVKPPMPPTPATLATREPKALTTPELAQLARTETNERLMAIVRELDTRPGPEVLAGLAAAASGTSSDVRELARERLQARIDRLDVKDLLARAEHAEAEVRRMVVAAILARHPKELPKLFDRLADRDDGIRQLVRTALVRESKMLDFGPEPGESETEARKARDRWRTWWELNR